MLPKFSVFIVFCAIVFTLVKCEYYRLPQEVKPVRYYLTIEPHLQDDADIAWETTSFIGTVEIQLEVLNNTNSITLHSKNLDIEKDNIEIISNEGKEIKIQSIITDETNQIFTIITTSELVTGHNYNLSIINFLGYLGNGEGFYLAKYFVNSTLYRRIAVTHFEPSSARRAFPCFDEPAFKARFVISLIRKENYNSVSNERLETTENLGNNRFKDTFKETPIMSTFTVAFAVSDFLSTETVHGHRVLGRPSEILKGKGEYPLHIGIETLKQLEDYTGIDFPIDKMEQFGVPNGYFYNHAMENYGLVIYGERHLLRNNDSSEADIKRTTVYISHEFAHMWFGNLVTPIWWDYIWISESFAAYFQYFIASRIKPTWELMDQFVVDVVNKAMFQEEFTQAAPLNYNITNIGQYPPFHIMYEKGASIIRMMAHFLTPEIFKKGLQIYLNNMKFRNSVPNDLYRGFQQAIDEAAAHNLLGNHSINEILRTWDSNKGYPILTVTRDYKTGNISLQQENKFDSNATQNWIIPINYQFSADGNIDFSKTTADFWFGKKSEHLRINYPTDGWLIVNKQRFGYYRVNYDIENWNRIITYMNTENFKNVHPLSRAQLIDDAFNFAHNQKLPFDIPLRLCEYLVRERHYVPLVTFYEALSNYIYLYSYYEDTNFVYFKNYTLPNAISSNIPDHVMTEYEVYKQYVRNTLQGVYEYYKNKPKHTDAHIDKLGRAKFESFISNFLILF